MAETFHYYMENLHHKHIVLTNPEEKKVSSKRASDSSRYTQAGLQKIKKKIRERLSAYKATSGVLLTLTVAGCDQTSQNYQGKSLPHAWKTIMEAGRAFSDELNKWRKRHGLSTIKAYIKVLEIQPGRYYPHLHIYYPGLKWLADLPALDQLWPYGIVNIKHTDSTSPTNYITKYLSKMEGRDFMNVMLFTFHLRMYSNSRGLRYAPKIPKDTAWGYSSAGTILATEASINEYLKAGYSLVSQTSMMPGGP